MKNKSYHMIIDILRNNEHMGILFAFPLASAASPTTSFHSTRQGPNKEFCNERK
ncbi:hypothetical protein KL86DES1_21917 [uncultured Desulfovibrio sp.]|uniref:Uncharacterized protein n=1 Tax=uncultured Desulfovibrio sp. TaxID=167968 RepID=A0A212L9Z5_9BACT|nr:hypothetical protein KL86DES1_21917 [uncultured Desulfovibrio sp.]VZH34814.1 conserved protein of unknown function [Desulfovibrio sp. 86]